MNKLLRFIHIYLLVGLPFVIACIVWETIQPENEILKNATNLTKILWNTLSWNLMFWFASLVLLLIVLVTVPQAREKTLKHLANLKERDEREEYITGKASRAAYIATLSLIVFFLFFSVFSLNVDRISQDLGTKSHLIVNINMRFKLLDQPRVENTEKDVTLFSSKNFSLSTSAILLIILIWQLFVFNITARKEQKKGL